MLPEASEVAPEIRATVRRALSTAPVGGGTDRSTDAVPEAKRVWALLSGELGIGGLTVPEERGGLGLGFVELGAVLEEAGRTLTPAPVLSTCGIATPVLLLAAGGADPWIQRVLEGDVATVALVGDDDDWDRAPGADIRAERQGQGWRLSGRRPFVLDLEISDFVIVPMRDGDEVAFFVVDTSAEGVAGEPMRTVDLSRGQGVLVLESAPASRLVVADGERLFGQVRDRAAVAAAAEQLGAAEATLELAVAYAKEREQFGRPIGSFQAVKHRLADMLVTVERTRSIVAHAIWALESHETEVPAIAAAAQATASDALREVAYESIQVHGGIGFTWEHDAQRFARRATAMEAFLGRPEVHRARVASYLATGALRPA